jgi:hypothetical protein
VTEVEAVTVEDEVFVIKPTSTQKVVVPTATPDIPTYINETYGIKFSYPESWTLTEYLHGVDLIKGPLWFAIRFRWADEEVYPFGPSGHGAGDFISPDGVDFLGQVIPADILSYEGKTKKVLFGETGVVDMDDIVYLLILEDRMTDYLSVDLADEVINETRTILESFQRIDIAEGSEAEGDLSSQQQGEVDGSQYWVTVEDPYYGVRFAIPCFWSAAFPEIYRPGSGYPIWNYTEEYGRSFGKNGSGVWESGGIKIDMSFIIGDDFGIQPNASLLDFITALTDQNPEVELVSIEVTTINNQESLFVTNESLFGISQFYVFNINEDTYLIFSPIQGTTQNPDVQAILHSIAIHPDVEVDVPMIIPGDPPIGIEAPCFE